MLSDMTWPESLNNMEEVFPASVLMCQSFPPNDPLRKQNTHLVSSYPVPSVWSLSWASRVFRIWSYLLQLCLLHFHWGMMLQVYVTTVSSSKNRGFISQVCICVCVCACVCACTLAQSLSRVWLFCNIMDYSLPSSSVHRTVSATILEWVAISGALLILFGLPGKTHPCHPRASLVSLFWQLLLLCQDLAHLQMFSEAFPDDSDTPIAGLSWTALFCGEGLLAFLSPST